MIYVLSVLTHRDFPVNAAARTTLDKTDAVLGYKRPAADTVRLIVEADTMDQAVNLAHDLLTTLLGGPATVDLDDSYAL